MTTGLAGRVKTLDGKPLEGVTLQIDNISTKTDANGRFVLSSILPGHHELRIDGRTASTITSNMYGIFVVGADILAEKTNVLPYAIWMPEIDKSTLVTIPSPTTGDVVLTTPHKRVGTQRCSKIKIHFYLSIAKDMRR